MKYCKKCLQPDTRPEIIFNHDQVCYACCYEESKKEIDWDLREKELKDIAKKAKEERKKRNGSYDCVIGVSGGKDSTFQAVYAKEKLGLRPLLVNCAPDEITDIGRKNLDNLSNLGFDMISIKPNPNIAKQLARKTFFERGNIVAASEYCLWSSAYIIADKFNISLVIQGENGGLTLGTSDTSEAAEDAFSAARQNTLKQSDALGLIEGEDNLSAEDVYFYQFPNIEEMRKKGIQAIYLQYYVKEWSQVGNADFSIARGFWGNMTDDLHDLGRYRRFTALDTDLSVANQMIKYLKFGFGFATDEACYDIREGRLSREDAVWYIKEYDGKCGDKFIKAACEYLSITEKEFWDVVDKYVNRDLFEKNESGHWIPKFEVGIDFD